MEEKLFLRGTDVEELSREELIKAIRDLACLNKKYLEDGIRERDMLCKLHRASR